ncbi:MAG: saccharopine dehydrogenase family protein [Candidatus Odinarchaeota archaeon]
MGTKVVVLGGCGAVGSVAVKTLVPVSDFSSIIIADINSDRARELVDEISSEKVSAVKVDANNPETIIKAIDDADVVLNCIGPFYKYAAVVLKAAIDAGKDYVDVCDDVDATREILELDVEARKAGITAVIGMGSSPGVTNLLARFAYDSLLDEVDTIDIYHAHGGEPFEGPGVVAHRFHSMSIDIPVFIDGEFRTAKFFEESGKTLEEEIDFIKLGKYPVHPYPHPETITMPRYLTGVKRVTNKGTVLPYEYFQLTMNIVKLGMTSETPLKVKDAMVSPHDFAIAYIIEQRERILKETSFGSQRGCVKIVVGGKKDGKLHRYEFSIASEKQALGEGTGIPAALASILLKRGNITAKGVLPPEACVEPLDFLTVMREVLDLESSTGGASPLIIESIDEYGKVERIDL